MIDAMVEPNFHLNGAKLYKKKKEKNYELIVN